MRETSLQYTDSSRLTADPFNTSALHALSWTNYLCTALLNGGSGFNSGGGGGLPGSNNPNDLATRRLLELGDGPNASNDVGGSGGGGFMGSSFAMVVAAGAHTRPLFGST